MIRGINHITLAVRDIERSFRFYHDLLQFKPLCKWSKGAYFLVGDLWFCLNVDEKRIPNSCYTHYAFTVAPQEFETISQRFLQVGVQVFKQNTSPEASFYFLDPDEHKLELHVGTWQSRLEAKKVKLGSWEDVEWFV